MDMIKLMKTLSVLIGKITALLVAITTLYQLLQSSGDSKKVTPIQASALQESVRSVRTAAYAVSGSAPGSTHSAVSEPAPVATRSSPIFSASEPSLSSRPLSASASPRVAADATPTVSRPAFNVLKDGKEFFAKDGYYLVAEEGLNIVPAAIGRSGAMVSIIGDGKVIQQQRMSKGDVVTVSYQGKEFRVHLTHVGRAGKNPFTKAAFFKVEKER